ncbi:hypothetical protein QUC26_17545 [Pseudomonas asiatica]|uniref:hypothetical protein n=1 Tax=Pseudomonas asiatica TaxID=2219225 RepID=UPI0025A27D89|nr:hypothetical protein [Pseudomonas asiatica]WJM51670.1 hypothetical protein QUC26_17545 [Pseudomonas asiatica]
MAYNSAHTGPEIDAAVQLLGDIQSAKDATAADRQAVDAMAANVAAQANQVSSQAATVNSNTAAVLASASAVESDRAEVEQNTALALGAKTSAEEAEVVAVSAKEAVEVIHSAISQSQVEISLSEQNAGDSASAARTDREIVEALAQQVEQHSTSAADSAASAAAVVTGGTATLLPEPGKIPLAKGNGEIDPGWLPDEIARTSAVELVSERVDSAISAADAADARTAGFLAPSDESPMLRDNGLPLQMGDRYFNTERQAEYIYSSYGWEANDSQQAIADIKNQNDPDKGAAEVGFDGDRLDRLLVNAKSLSNYSDLQAYTGRATGIQIVDPLIAGPFYRDDSDTTSPPRLGFVVVDALSRRWKRKYQGLPNPLWCGADPTGAQSALVAFNLAASVCGQVQVTAGTYLLDQKTADASWVLEKGVVIKGLPTVGGNALMDLSRLSGRVVAYQAGGRIGLRLGDSDPWLERNIRNFSESLAHLVALSPEGRIGGLFASRTSGNSSSNMATIGLSAYGVNDNSAVPKTSYSGYAELVRFPNCGPAYNFEMDGVNLGDTYKIDPFKAIAAYDATKGATVHLWLSCGGGDSGLAAAANNMSAAMVMLPNSKRFDRGRVVRSGSIESGEVIAMPTGYSFSWYSAAENLNSYIDHRTIDQRTRIDSAIGNIWSSRKHRATTSTISLDAIHQHIFYGATDPATSYEGASTKVLQRSAFVSGNARFSFDIRARNSDGTHSEVTLNGASDKSLAPVGSKNISLGTASNEFSAVFAVNGIFSGPVKCGQYTLATLPSAAAFAGHEIDITDAAGGPKRCRSDGSVWKILNTNTAVS